MRAIAIRQINNCKLNILVTSCASSKQCSTFLKAKITPNKRHCYIKLPLAIIQELFPSSTHKIHVSRPNRF